MKDWEQLQNKTTIEETLALCSQPIIQNYSKKIILKKIKKRLGTITE